VIADRSAGGRLTSGVRVDGPPPRASGQDAGSTEPLPPGQQPLRVATWNLWWRFGDWQQQQDAIVAVLAAGQPDIIGLQEVWSSPTQDQAELLAGELGMYWAFVPSPAPHRWQQRLGDQSIGIGNAVLSRWPITDLEHQSLPAPAEENDGRVVVHAAIAAPGGRIPFFTTQLTSAPQLSAIRCAQVRALARFVAARPAGHPPVVTGDLNAEPDSDEVRLLGGHKTAPAVPGLVLIDAWRYADPGRPGWTWDRRNPHVRATGEPSARIDYVLIGPAVGRGRGRVLSSALIGDRSVEGTWPSDHAGVLVTLQP
jgi:endonuclease/exonuclease/phosphatase family metal-dependent hydrolase